MHELGRRMSAFDVLDPAHARTKAHERFFVSLLKSILRQIETHALFELLGAQDKSQFEI